MKRITMFVLSLCIMMAAMAQIDTSKEYRIKDNSTGKYLNVANFLAHESGQTGGVNVANKAESNDQIFTFEASGSGYYVKAKSGNYIKCQPWNVDAYSTTDKTLLTLEQATNGYYIKWDNKNMNGNDERDDYFKVENSYVFCDANKSSAATWTIVEKDADTGSSGGTIVDPLASNEIYDYSGFKDKNILDLFYKALQKGRNYPTLAEFEAAGIQASDIAFTRSHVRRAEIMSRADRLVEDTYESRNLFMNIPMDFGKDGSVGQPGTKFHSDVYSMWQYTNLFGSWNKGVFQAPAAWVDAAHRNGTDIMSGIEFFESWTGDGDAGYSAMITQKDAQGNFVYVKPLINALMYFGADGINYNWEDDSYSNSDIVAFHKALYKYAAECGFTNYHSAIYTAQQGLTSSNANALFGNSEGRTHDTMLNYNGGDFTTWTAMQSSVNAAQNAMGTTDGLYTGVWIASINRSWSNLARNATIKKIGICLWGEHGQSRFWQFNQGNGVYDTQGNYQRLYERAMSGGYRNPANRPASSSDMDSKYNWRKDGNTPALSNFAGLATWIPERSAIQGDFHFLTHFTLGNGDRYYYKGKQSHPGGWYNMSSQDLVPTYRWLRYKANTTTVTDEIDVNYTHVDAYTGGSCIELTGASTSTGTDIIIYKTNLKVTGSNPYAKLAVKTLKNTKSSDLYLILKLQGESSFREYAYGALSGNTWEEKTINLGDITTGKTVERIGLRVKGNNADYQLYVGKLELNDNSTVAPAEVNNLYVEVKNETKTSMVMKMYWDVNATAKTRANWGLVYNDEANIDHFEILYKIGENGKVALIGKTASWATTVGNFEFESVNDEPYIGVRAVSTDLKTCSEIKWQKVERAAQSTLPEKVEEDTYGISMLDIYSEGIYNARMYRYLTEVKTTGATQNLNYTASSPNPDSTNYVYAPDVLKVKQGQNVTLSFKAFDHSDGLMWCAAQGWIDYNGSGDFDHSAPASEDPESEQILDIYNLESSVPAIQSGYSTTFTVPANATPGKSRMRIVFTDSWFLSSLNPTGGTAKGFTIDFDVEITGSNPGRVSVDTRDQGEADQPEGIDGSQTAVEDVVAEGVSAAEGVEGAINIVNAEKAWVYTVDGKLVEFVKNPAQVAVEPGVYLVKMLNGNIIRSSKVLVK